MFALALLLFAAPVVRLEAGQIVASGLDAPARASLTVHVADASHPAMLGTVRTVGKALVFAPRFPLRPGIVYVAVLKVGDKTVASRLSIPKAKRKPTATVEAVYPSARKLPENQLKFYIHFTAPMEQGGSFKHIRLLDEKGKAVDLPFLELDQELWDAASKRFTLFFDPGRIKRGLKPREDHGPALIEGKRYTLVVSRAWLDAEGEPLKAEYRKSFEVGPPDDAPPEPKKWKLKAPVGRAPLRVEFGESMESALAQRMLWVENEAGKRIVGKVSLKDNERVWLFTPKVAWKAGVYSLVADTRLEDLAGNSIGRPFEVDLLRPVDRTVKKAIARIAFRVE